MGFSSAGQPGSRGRRLRRLGFAAGVIAAALLAANALVAHLERRGVVDTFRIEDSVNMVEAPLFEQVADGRTYRTTRYAARTMIRSRFPVHKGKAWRAFVVGGSFAMGVPYSRQRDKQDLPGGLVSWLRWGLGQRYPGQALEVINAGSAGGDSSRVRGILQEVLRYAPDLIVLSTCNNELREKPPALSAQLHRLGGYRLLLKLLLPSQQPRYKELRLEDPRLDGVRQEFGENLRQMIKATGQAGVPVLLTTLPVNLLFEGSRAMLWLPDPDDTDACVDQGIALHRAGQYPQAVAHLQTCADTLLAARWIGLSLVAQGRFEQGRELLLQNLEMFPATRCRPSLSRLIRQAAASAAHVHLVDLEQIFYDRSPHALPGYRWFVDHCHLGAEGHRVAAEAILERIVALGLGPRGARAAVDTPLPLDRFRRRIRQHLQTYPGFNEKERRFLLQRDYLDLPDLPRAAAALPATEAPRPPPPPDASTR